MSLSSNLKAALQAAQGTASGLVRADEGDRQATCEVVQCDAMAVSLMELTLLTGALANVPIGPLRDASQALCQRLTYLLEPISPIETDADQCVVQMRSNPPQADDNGLRYYELLMRRGGAVTLRRYEKSSGNPRAPVSATLTHEVIGRLVDDFNAAVDGAVSG